MEHQDLRGGIITKEEKSVGYLYNEEIAEKHLPGKHDQESHGGNSQGTRIVTEFKTELSLIPARIRFIGKEEYDGVISRKSVEGESTADIFIMVVPPKESR